MRSLPIVVAILSMSLGVATLASAQDNPDTARPKENRQDKTRRPRNASPQQTPHASNANPGQQRQIDRTPDQQQEQQRLQLRAWQQRRANHFQYEHRTWLQRGGYLGIRVPGEFAAANFGQAHSFRIYSLPFKYEAGNPRFLYGGYWFTMLDPFPEDWSGTWYQNDDVFVEYRGDGYYLFNRRYPNREGIALNVSLEGDPPKPKQN